jgi:glycosyltransferase involved in cell wall biosynthesis
MIALHMTSAQGAKPGVTVVTAVLNGRATLEHTLSSVREQTWTGLEHVVVDGGSSDGTLELLRAAPGRLRWSSAPDRGLYDAMNRGLAQVSDPHRYVVFLNADDTFHRPDSVARVMSQSHGEDVVYGRLERWDDEFDFRDVIGREVRGRAMLYGMRCHHQTMFCRREVFDRVGGFDLHYRIAADYDWVVRVFRRSDVSTCFVPVVVATMRRGGLSDRSYLQSLGERWQIVNRNFPPLDVLRYALWTGFGDYGRHHLQRVLRRVGLLHPARRLKRTLRGGAT